MNLIKKLEAWFLDHCDEEWEHENTLRIETTDNPGWSITIDLTGLIDEEAINKPWTLIDESESSWYGYKLVDGVFSAWGGQFSLECIIDLLLSYSLENSKS